LRAEGRFLEGTGDLVAERRVGRGRVVVTAFSLAGSDIQNWECFDGFFNACLLRRPPREFVATRFGSVRAQWAVEGARNDDARLVTATRYFSRDTGPARPASVAAGSADAADWHLDGSVTDRASGVGGWNDDGAVASAAHSALQQAAGIWIPRAGFVARVLAVYLVVLVPLNWGFFRLLGRVEWAWVAAPVLAVVGAVIVIRLAQLDIGFARSRTEIAVLELHGGHARAHLTRYTALYTSLSSAYDFAFDDPSAVARPFPPTQSPSRLSPVWLRHDRGVGMTGFRVNSNMTGFVHSEQMSDLGGAVRLVMNGAEPARLENRTALRLRDAGLWYRTERGDLMECWLGPLAPRSTAAVRFVPAAGGRPWFSQWEQEAVAVGGPAASGASLRKLAELAAGGQSLGAGDVRMVAWTQDDIPGLAVSPASTQTRVHVMVLAHLRFGRIPAPRPDLNLKSDVLEKADEQLPSDAPAESPNDVRADQERS